MNVREGNFVALTLLRQLSFQLCEIIRCHHHSKKYVHGLMGLVGLTVTGTFVLCMQQEAGVYMVSNAPIEGDRVDSMSHATRVSPATVSITLCGYFSVLEMRLANNYFNFSIFIKKTLENSLCAWF